MKLAFFLAFSILLLLPSVSSASEREFDRFDECDFWQQRLARLRVELAQLRKQERVPPEYEYKSSASVTSVKCEDCHPANGQDFLQVRIAYIKKKMTIASRNVAQYCKYPESP